MFQKYFLLQKLSSERELSYISALKVLLRLENLAYIRNNPKDYTRHFLVMNLERSQRVSLIRCEFDAQEIRYRRKAYGQQGSLTVLPLQLRDLPTSRYAWVNCTLLHPIASYCTQTGASARLTGNAHNLMARMTRYRDLCIFSIKWKRNEGTSQFLVALIYCRRRPGAS